MDHHFQCLHCARCCTHAYAASGLEECLQVSTAREYLACRLGLCWETPDDRLYLLLFNDEMAQMQRHATQHHIDFRPLPLLYAMDEVSDTIVVLCWTLDHDSCPFLFRDEGKPRCSIHAMKPLVCRAFPVIRSDKRGVYAVSEICIGFPRADETALESVLGAELQVARTIDRRMAELVARFILLREQGRIKPCPAYDLEEVSTFVRGTVLARKYTLLEEIA